MNLKIEHIVQFSSKRILRVLSHRLDLCQKEFTKQDDSFSLSHPQSTAIYDIIKMYEVL